MITFFLLALYFLGAFDIVLNRFGADDLSSGRNDSTQAMLAVEKPKLVSGYGENFNAYASSLIGVDRMAMFSEYSLLALCYKFGVVYVVLMCALLLWPAFSVARATGKWIIAFMAVTALVYYSTFNGLVGVPDTYLIMVVFGLSLNSLRPGIPRPRSISEV